MPSDQGESLAQNIALAFIKKGFSKPRVGLEARRRRGVRVDRLWCEGFRRTYNRKDESGNQGQRVEFASPVVGHEECPRHPRLPASVAGHAE